MCFWLYGFFGNKVMFFSGTIILFGNQTIYISSCFMFTFFFVYNGDNEVQPWTTCIDPSPLPFCLFILTFLCWLNVNLVESNYYYCSKLALVIFVILLSIHSCKSYHSLWSLSVAFIIIIWDWMIVFVIKVTLFLLRKLWQCISLHLSISNFLLAPPLYTFYYQWFIIAHTFFLNQSQESS
jgi:hypothetical protein